MRSETPNAALIATHLSQRVAGALALVGACGLATPGIAGGSTFSPGNLLLSRTVYDNNANNVVAGTTLLPAGCTSGTTGCAAAAYNGAYPTIFNNSKADGSFGITTQIFLDQLTPAGSFVNTLSVPNSTTTGVTGTSDQMVTSFSSKSELALNLSTDGQYVTFMGYFAPVDALDISNSNTPGVVDATNPVVGQTYRVVASVNANGAFQFTSTNAYSGNNGRAAILNNAGGVNYIYTVGNAGNGANPQPNGIILGAGAQIMQESALPLAQQTPGQPTPVGSFDITELPGNSAHDKIGKDTNFRGLTLYKNVVYLTKGSGSNGVNTVYFIDTSGLNANGEPAACPNGSGLPNPDAPLPNAAQLYNAANLQTAGVAPYNMCVLSGFPTTLAKTATAFPFGVWFASPTVMYVTDEGNGTTTYNSGTNTYTAAASQTTAGLQKWVFNSSTGAWSLAYTLQSGLNLGTPYTVAGYPTGNNALTSLPWSPATDGLRNLTGKVNGDGTATIWALTSTVSGSGDQGADPNQLVQITDNLGATTLPGNESFTTLRTAGFAEVLRGISFTPGTTPASTDWIIAGTGDFNHDGNSDILWRDNYGNVLAWNMNGAAVSSLAPYGNVSTGWNIAGIGDFNGDGYSDVLWRHSSGETYVYLSNGSGGFAGVDLGAVTTDWQIAAVADFNGDGKADILWRNTSGEVAVWYGNGSGAFTVADLGPVSTAYSIAGVGDFNHDGKADVLWRATNGDAYLWLSNGSGGFTGADLGIVPTAWMVAAVGDFNGDGKADILWRYTSGEVAVWFGNGSGGFTSSIDLGPVSPAYTIASIGDFNHDGKTDVLWRATNGDAYLWLNNGAGGFTGTDFGVIP